MSPRFAPLAVLVCLLGAGCAFGPEGDGRNDSFGGNAAKADGQFTECQLAQVLRFVNDSATDTGRLRDIDLTGDAASAIVAHRHGPDGDPGTGDDDIYDDLNELDAVDFVGPVALDRLVGAILSECEVDLETRPFINEKTFEGSSGSTTGRDNVELEAAMTVGGITGQKLHEILFSDDRGRTVFERLSKARIMEAFTYEFAIDEMPWDSDSHAAREALPFVPLSIESDRYPIDQDSGERELDLGTDVMEDTYYDSYDYRLLRASMILRGRVRWDDPDTVRRLLIASKFNPFIDDNGIKRASKVDIRTFGDTHMASLDDDVRRGKVNWQSPDSPAEPIRELYFKLLEEGRLPTIGQHQDVLILDPKVHLRGTRRRYHLDLADRSSMRDFYANGRARLQEMVDQAQAAIDAGFLSAQAAAAAADLVALGNGLIDGTAVADRARADLLAIDPGMDVSVANLDFPDELGATAASFADLEKARVVAEAVDALYHELGAALDDLDRDLTETRGLDFDEYVDMFVAWRKSERSELRRIRTARAFLDEWQRLDELGDAALATALGAFNDFAAARQADGDDDFEDFAPLAPRDAAWQALGKHLRFEHTKISQRMIEGAGTTANALWFDQAREFYVPASSRPFGNFIIDTMDMTEMMTQQEWNRLPEAERRIDVRLDPATVFHTNLVNEIQIELGQEEAYVARIEELAERVGGGGASDDDVRDLEGARFVFAQFNDALSVLSAVKEEDLLDDLEDAGAPNTVSWVAAEASKGTTALLLLADIL